MGGSTVGRRRHEVRYDCFDRRLHIPASFADRLSGDADADRSFRRGNLWAVGRALSDGASRSRGLRGLLPEREPSGPITIRFGEKGLLWLRIAVRTRGAHGLTPSVAERDRRLLPISSETWSKCTRFRPPRTRTSSALKMEAGSLVDLGARPARPATVQRITLNIGTIAGGLKVNMVPGICSSMRISGRRWDTGAKTSCRKSRPSSAAIRSQHHANQLRAAEGLRSVCDMVGVSHCKQRPGAASTGPSQSSVWAPSDALPVGAQRGVPVYILWPFPMRIRARLDEYVDIEDFLHVVRVLAPSALDYLTGYLRQLVRDPRGEQRRSTESS